MPKRAEPPEIADTSSLTDADWAAINVLKRAHALGGDRALGQAVQALSKHDPGRYIRIMAAYFRDRVRETVKDEMAGGELTIEDIREKLGEMLAMQEAELKDLAETLAQWVDAVPGFPLVYLFGSRVRGDHYKDSDVDVRLFLDEWKPIPDPLQWWEHQNQTDFAELKTRLPGPLKIHRETKDDADRHIRAGMARPVLLVRKVVCVWTPPLSGSAPFFQTTKASN